MLSIAQRISSSDWTSAIRTWPSPDGPKAAPGVTMTPDFSSSSRQNCTESVYPSGRLAQTNIVAGLLSTFHPIAVSPSQRMSLRLR